MDTSYSQCTTHFSAPLTTRRAVSTWLTRARAWWARRRSARPSQRTDSELTALDGLSAHTLSDIGAPEWMVEQAQRAEARARQGGLFERDALHWR